MLKFFLFLNFLISILFAFPSLKFSKATQQFKTLQLTDLHFGEDKEKDIQTILDYRFYIKEINPDLVIITGDTVSGYAWDNFDQNFYQSLWSNFSNVFIETKTYYAYALGNHDHQANYNREQIVKLDMSNPYSLMNATEELNWASAYHFPIYSSLNESKLVTNIWIFDSGDRFMMNASWGKISQDQLNWYHKETNNLRNIHGEIPHSMAFFHIPPPEFNSLWNWGSVYGEKTEGVCCPIYDNGAINSFKKEGDITAVFCGHDHNNYYGGWYDGVELIYGRKTGHGGYGPPENVTRGCRVIELTEKFSEIDGVIEIKRNHYIFDEKGDIILNGPSYKRDYMFQIMCDPADGWALFDKFSPILVIPIIYIIWRLIHRRIL